MPADPDHETISLYLAKHPNQPPNWLYFYDLGRLFTDMVKALDKVNPKTVDQCFANHPYAYFMLQQIPDYASKRFAIRNNPTFKEVLQ